MQAIMEQHKLVAASQCDYTAKMGIPAIFSQFMDLAGEHALYLKISSPELEKRGLFWLTTKTRVKIHRRPDMLEPIHLRTWPQEPARIRCNRFYQITSGDETLVEGKSEWAIIDPAAGRLKRISEVYPTEIEHCPDTVCDEPFYRFPDGFDTLPEFYSYTVRSTDTDLGRHLNNAVYLRILFSAFSTEQLSCMNITEVEIAFLAQTFEGETLSLRKRECDGGFEVGMLKADGTLAAGVKVVTE